MYAVSTTHTTAWPEEHLPQFLCSMVLTQEQRDANTFALVLSHHLINYPKTQPPNTECDLFHTGYVVQKFTSNLVSQFWFKVSHKITAKVVEGQQACDLVVKMGVSHARVQGSSPISAPYSSIPANVYPRKWQVIAPLIGLHKH